MRVCSLGGWPVSQCVCQSIDEQALILFEKGMDASIAIHILHILKRNLFWTEIMTLTTKR